MRIKKSQNKWFVIIPILASIIVSINFDAPYYFNLSEFFIILPFSLLVFKDIWNYIQGEDFWSFGSKIESTDSKLERAYWFILLLILYLIMIYYFSFEV
ncbi:hypothetical protein ACFBZI_06205 [Moraxella sp. ZJ142]|uniref:hypothetical protein n=1 Tax=Moraxella marmotae TaxID=3344520 RepID=UPI0035D3E475